MRAWIVAAVSLSLLVPSLAFAQTKSTSAPRQPKTTIIFGDDELTGTRSRPDVDYVEADGHVVFKSLIKLRANFDNEIKNSVHELR